MPSVRQWRPAERGAAKTYGFAAWSHRGRKISRFQPAIPTTSDSRKMSGHVVSQIHSPSITGRNSSQTAP